MAVERPAAQGLEGSLNGLRYAVSAWLHSLGRTDAGTARTPDRVARAWAEMTSGYGVDVEAILATRFECSTDELVVVTDVPVVSLCEHHVMPFTGTAVVGYLPDGWVLGLSKIPRLVEAYSRRLQIQEALTEQIADAIDRSLRPKAVGVIIEAQHSCTACRGARAPARMVTSAMRGLLRESDGLRAEFLSVARG